jgi:transcriptional regulator CtsR
MPVIYWGVLRHNPQKKAGDFMSLVRQIENYLKEILSEQTFLEIQRNELAKVFQCVPSQINYVLGTRFTPSQGYVVESRRGGGGYLRIVKLSWTKTETDRLSDLFDVLGDALTQQEAEGILSRLKEEEWLSDREYQLLRALMSREVLDMAAEYQDALRAKMLQVALIALCRED